VKLMKKIVVAQVLYDDTSTQTPVLCGLEGIQEED
jgi:hypothetical protein